MSETRIAKIQRQPTRSKVTQSPNVVITTTRVEIVVAPNTNVVRVGVLIGSTTNLGSGLDGVLPRRNLSRSSALPTTTIGVIGSSQMVFTNPIMTIHVNM